MHRLNRVQDVAAPELPFLARHLPLVLTLLFIAALHQPLARGLAPQIEYVTALIGYEPASYELPAYETPANASQPSQDGILIETPARPAPRFDLISI